jgi:hypothetical protein
MSRDGEDQAASVGARRVRNYRSRRRAAGLVEVKAWVRAEDVPRAWTALRPLTAEADEQLGRRARQARTNQIPVELRFARTPPESLREALRREWALVWDQGSRCWRGLAEDSDQVEALRQLVAPHGGEVGVG